MRYGNPGVGLALAALALLAGCHGSAPEHEAQAPLDWTTPAERAEFRSTPSYAETLQYLDQLAEVSADIEVQRFGESGQGRQMHVAVVSSERLFTPRIGSASGKPVVLLLNGIHSGEIAGKDATLMFLRDLLVEGRYPEILEEVVLVVVPVYNVDGHERVGQSRINQDGPADGMGFRTNASGLDLNRDFMKLDSAEAQNLIDALVARWNPHLLVDAHTTDGAKHQYHLTYGLADGPLSSPAAAEWSRGCMDRVARRMEEAGRPVARYRSPVDRREPAAGLRSGFTTPRFSTSYMALRGRAAVLVEAHSLKPYQTRVEATYDLLTFLLGDIAADPGALTGATGDTGALSPGTPVPLRLKRVDDSEPFLYRTHTLDVVDGEVGGEPYTRYRDELLDVEVPVFDGVVAELEVEAPAGYLIPPQYPEVVRRLRLHGLEVFPLDEGVTLPVEMIRIGAAEFGGAPYQGRHRADVTEWSIEEQQRPFPAGSVWVPMDQPTARIAVHLLEPCGPDSFFAWGFFSSVMERKEYFERYVMEPMAQQMLDEDDELRAEFEQRLEQDEEFRDSSWQRLEFFYRRTEHADPDWRLYPVARVGPEAAAGLPALPSP
jgi:hypothetical protein